MSSWASIAGSWGCFAGVVILGWYYYTKDNGQPKRIGRQKSTGSIGEALKEIAIPTEQKKSKPKKKTAKSPVVETNNSDAKGKASSSTLNKKSGNAIDTAQSSAIEVKANSNREISQDADVNVKEFAQRMAKAQAGTTFSNSKKENQRIRTQKQSKANGTLALSPMDGQEHISETSSNTGAEADDDLSSVNSAPHAETPVANGSSGVADMLEESGPGPSTLRITEPLVTKAPKKHIKKEVVAEETKKQRQNRVRREREKEANREAEAQRRILEEKQRRTAREAEGRPAKNGNGWTYDSGLPANAWPGKAQAKSNPATNGLLLDTTEEPVKSSVHLGDTATAAVSKSEPTNGVHGGDISSNGAMAQWDSDLPSEEEQFRLIQEQSEESEWTTVAQPKRSKRKNTGAEDSSKKAPNEKQQSLFPAGFQTDVMD